MPSAKISRWDNSFIKYSPSRYFTTLLKINQDEKIDTTAEQPLKNPAFSFFVHNARFLIEFSSLVIESINEPCVRLYILKVLNGKNATILQLVCSNNNLTF